MLRIKERLREITSRSNDKGDAWRKVTGNTFIRGWVNYYKLADMKSALERIDKWYWHTAKSPILSTTISNERLKRAGYLFFTDYSFKVSPSN
jgi:hypothetical protein